MNKTAIIIIVITIVVFSAIAYYFYDKAQKSKVIDYNKLVREPPANPSYKNESGIIKDPLSGHAIVNSLSNGLNPDIETGTSQDPNLQNIPITNNLAPVMGINPKPNPEAIAA